MWVLVCAVLLAVCYYHVTYVFQIVSTLYSCLNVKELLARNRHDVWSLSESNEIWTQNHLARIFQATIECRFSMKRVCDVIITYSQMHLLHKCSQHNSIIWSVWLNVKVFVYESNGCGFESRCYHLKNFRYCACFEQGVPWHSNNYMV